MIAHYALLPPDPTSQAHLVFISASEITANMSVAGQYVSPDSAQIPSRSEWITHYRVSGLMPGQMYEWSIGAETGLPLRTFPGAMPPAGLTAVAMADIHIEIAGAAMNAPSEMDVIGSQGPDFALFPGDMANAFREDFSEENGSWWIKLCEDYLPRLSSEFLVPCFAVPGNHEVGNHLWDGSGSVNPDGTYFQVFFPNAADANEGKNYAAIMLGDWLQVIGIDTHSATTNETASWAPEQINPDAPVVFPFYHSPMFAADIRGANDPDLQAGLRDALFAAFYDAPNVLGGTCGHIHARTRTKPLGVFGSDPGGDDKISLGDDWIAEEAGGYIEVGQGYRSDRSGGDTQLWFLEVAERNEKNFQRLDFSQGSFRWRTINAAGATIWDETWERPRSRRVQSVRDDGSLVTPSRGGVPVYAFERASP